MGWPCTNFGAKGGHYYQGEPVPGACIPSGLPISLEEPWPLGGSDGRVPKDMWELVEGGGETTMEELLRKWDEERGGEEEVEEVQEEAGAQGEVPPAVVEAEPLAPLAPEEVEVAGPLTLGEEAQQRWEAPARSSRGKEHAV